MLRQRYSSAALALAVTLSAVSPHSHAAEQKLVIKPLAEKQVTELPAGPLFWRIENFPAIAQARAAAGPTALVAEAAGKVWLFTLGPAGGVSRGGTKVAEVGPLRLFVATRHARPPTKYLLRINEAIGTPGSRTRVHTHPGIEAFYVLSGEMSQRTPSGVTRVAAGQSAAGHSTDMPMQVWNSGSSGLHSLVMFVVDAARPFSSPAEFHFSGEDE